MLSSAASFFPNDPLFHFLGSGWFVRLDVGLSWFAALATLLLVPPDVAIALRNEEPGMLPKLWQIAYWYSLLAQCIFLPLHMEYTRSGQFTVKERLIAALRYNVLYYTILAAIGVGGLILLLAAGHLAPANIAGFAIAVSNAYGLIAAIFLMGYGLYAIPLALWRRADAEGERLRLCHAAGTQAERAYASHKQLSLAVITARKASVLFAPHDPLRPCMDLVIDLANSVGSDFKFSATEVPDDAELDFFDRYDLARLRKTLKIALRDYERENALYKIVVQEYITLEERVRKAQSFEPPPSEAPVWDRVQFIYHSWQLHFYLYRIAAILAGIASTLIIIAETTVPAKLPDSSVVSWVLHSVSSISRGGNFLTQMLCFAFLAYPLYCSYYSLYRLGQVAFYRMVPQHTDSYSLCYSGFLMCRFAAPLAFNFIAAVALPTKKWTVGSGGSAPDVTSTVFYSSFGSLMEDQPLIGWRFTTFAPAILAPYVLLLAVGFFEPLVESIGALVGKTTGYSGLTSGTFQFENDFELGSGHAQAGMRLLRAEVDAVQRGLPIGLTIEPTGGVDSEEIDKLIHTVHQEEDRDGGRWWKNVFSSTEKKGGISSSSSSAYSGSKAALGRKNSEVEEARSRLAKAVGQRGVSIASASAPLLDNDFNGEDVFRSVEDNGRKQSRNRGV